jgi:hypothetical protein
MGWFLHMYIKLTTYCTEYERNSCKYLSLHLLPFQGLKSLNFQGLALFVALKMYINSIKQLNLSEEFVCCSRKVTNISFIESFSE